ncbi:MAG: cyclic nucleotide-binding domain-containing protein [Rhodospirillales bacterium]|nr:cyclic nucleotide-binding domain-containing protein [Rhodospirillales bacterium]
MNKEVMAEVWRCPLCTGLPPECLAKLDGHVTTSRHVSGDLLFSKEMPADRLIIVLEGHVILYLDDAGSRNRIARIVAAGETCGEAAICGLGTYGVTAEVLGPTRIAAVSGAALCDVLAERFDLMLRLLTVLSVQLRALIREIADLKMKSAAQRLGLYLLGLTDVQRGPARVQLPYMKRLMAEALGMQPETLSRAFTKLQAVGVRTDSDDNACAIDDVAALRHFCKDASVEAEDARAGGPPNLPHGAGRAGVRASGHGDPPSRTHLNDADFDVVRHAPLFAGLAADELADLVDGAGIHVSAKRQHIFSAGDPADAFFVVLEGAVKLFVLSPEGCETIIEVVRAGATFAEAAIFASAGYPVHAEAFEDTRLLRIHRHDFLAKLRRNPSLALQMFVSLGQWQLLLMGEMWQLKAQTPAQRLAWTLLKLTTACSGPATITLRDPKSVVAARIGITPESLSRALTRLANLGVETRGNEITIASIEDLRRFAGL